ncbi:MAG: hypothetical protein EAZ28_01665 [Oscillatoriales cyanobacterium]|nr:MAG: hypothetical protein EAZ28_01665 [Oscillatoriales cyanobacterium]
MADLTNEERIAQQIRPIEVGNAGLAILGTKFNDLGGGAGGRPDGIRQPNEPGLPNVRFLLEPAATSNGVFNPSAGEAETTSDANGAFSFINLVPGNYVVTELPFAGFTPTTPSRVPVTIDNRNVNVVFGNSRDVSLFSNIVGCKYLDLDGDGFRDGNEPGIKNVRIYLDGSNGSVPNGRLDPGELSTLTDKNGEWKFNGIAPGKYRVREVSETRVDLLGRSGFVDRNNEFPQTLGVDGEDFPQTTPPDNVPVLDVTVAAGETFACAQVGDTQLYKIVVNKFQDLDRNGRRNIVGASLEPAVSLVPFILDENRNGKFDAGEEIRFTDATERGEATFEDLRAGNYPVLEIFNTTLPRSLLSPAELSILATRPELTNGVPSDQFRPGNFNLPVPTTPNPLVVSAPGPLATAQSTISRNQPFLVQDSTYTLKAQDPKFIDLNGDGFQQLPGEVSIPLTGLRPIFTNTPLPFPALNPSPSVVFSPIAPNNTVAGNTGVGNTRPNINIFKYNDQNANGRYDPQFLPNGALNITGNGERPIPGVQVFLDLNNDGVLQANEPTRTTNSDGRAVFQNIAPPGNYTVREVVPANFSASTPAAVTFALNTEDALVTFANTPKSKITGCKFEDFNQNGYRDGNEPPISGITVYLDANNNGILDPGETRTTTDRFGTFTFDNLNPGKYTVREDSASVPSNFKQTTQSLEIDLGPNQTFTCALIGNVRLYDLLVPKFQDDNRDGIRNGNEPLLNDVPFALDENENGVYDVGEPLVRTGADGIFGTAVFKDLLPGTYSVLEVFNNPRVPNPFPIQTGPNPVSFDVPGSGVFTVPSPVRPAATPERAIMSLDPLTEGGLVAAQQVSMVDSLLVPQNAGAANVVDFNQLKISAEASIVSFIEAQKLDDKLMLGAPVPSPLF